MVGREERYQNVAFTAFLQTNIDSVSFRFVRFALTGFRNDYVRGRGKDEPELPRFFASTGRTYQKMTKDNENVLWFNTDIVGFLELFHNIERLIRFLVPFM